MDPLSQGLLGAAVAACFSKRKTLKVAVICGALGGMAPDLDVLIRSANDPLLRIEYHRHFTHSLAFIPFGGLLVAAFLWLATFRKAWDFTPIYLFTTLGFATHGLLDACTSYGTRLYWPFSDLRVSWNIISIIDPVFTLTLCVFLLLALRRRSVRLMKVGLGLALLYLGYGALTHANVMTKMRKVAEARGHTPTRMLLNPTIGNLVLWRSVYEAEGIYYVDAVYAPPLTAVMVQDGARIPTVDADTVFPTLALGSVQREDIKRFAYFSQGYIYRHPDHDSVLGDLRYGTLPDDAKSLWGIRVNPDTPDAHTPFVSLRQFEDKHFDEFWLMLWGEGNKNNEN